MATLNSMLNCALAKPVNISKVGLSSVAKVLRDEFGDDPYMGAHVRPETEALDFYLANHVVGLIRTKKGETKPLTNAQKSLLEKYVARSNEMALRAFAYMLLICSREMRHIKTTNPSKFNAPKAMQVYNQVRGKGGNHIAHWIWQGDIDCTTGEWIEALEEMFRTGSWNGGYGGKKWADVTLCLLEYVRGVYTAEMMVDVVWTLCHNGGPIFNKGMLYHTHGPELLRVLDVQRAGQVPNFEWGSTASGWYADFLDTASGVFPELSKSADIELIKLTAVHSSLWSGSQYKTPGLKTVKPEVHGHGGIVVKSVKVERDDE